MPVPDSSPVASSGLPQDDPVVFSAGDYEGVFNGCHVTVHVEDDVRLSHIQPALSRLVRARKEGKDESNVA